MTRKILKIIEQTPVRLWYVLALFCFIPALLSPFYSDDFFHLLLLSENPILQRDMPGSIFGLFAFVDQNPLSSEQMRSFSVIPWWADENFYFRFWRPLTEVSHWLDFELLGQTAFASHLVSVALFLLAAFVFLEVAKKLSVEYSLFPVLAFVVFILDGQHVATVSWIANRNAILAALFSLISFYFFVSFIQRRKLQQYFAALIFFVAGLLSGEAAIAITVYYFFYCIFYNEEGFKNSIGVLLPFALVSLLWVMLHQQMGYGAEPSGNSYVNPFSYPDVFIARLFEHMPVYFFSHLSSSPAGAYWTIDGWQAGFKQFYWPVSVLVSLGFIVLVREELKESRFLRFSLLCVIFSALPACLANPQDRLSMMQSIATAWFFALLILLLVEAGKKKMALLLLFLHLLVSPIHLLVGGSYMNYESRAINDSLLRFDEGVSIQGKNVVLLDVPIGHNVMLTGVRAVNGKALPDSIFYLGNDAGDLNYQRSGSNGLHVERSVPFASGFEDGFRNIKEHPFYAGQKIMHKMVEVEVLDVDAGGYPLALKLKFNDKLDDILFYRFQHGQFVRVEI